ncbi:hypothetical protein L1987_83827 [Smallanthus sonchifolius]|uniref:Uncharacterized protein n=1 Tax=Smallanthus sonchifolius TaxID=185202 RepID=A0ACB8YDK1_9ASTR|nr:hypothetical protein L1987_83827 [Smallanthus sonchifolius]
MRPLTSRQPPTQVVGASKSSTACILPGRDFSTSSAPYTSTNDGGWRLRSTAVLPSSLDALTAFAYGLAMADGHDSLGKRKKESVYPQIDLRLIHRRKRASSSIVILVWIFFLYGFTANYLDSIVQYHHQSSGNFGLNRCLIAARSFIGTATKSDYRFFPSGV